MEQTETPLKGHCADVYDFVHGWKQIQVVKPEVCRACGLCVSACPENAITLPCASTDRT